MSTVFEDDASYLVLRNEERQYSLWPAYLRTPQGWQVVYGPASTTACQDHVERHWRDPRPASLVAAGGHAQQKGNFS